jgi:hypothetical protein
LSADERSPSGGITIEPSSAQQNALPALPIYGALALLTSVRRALDHLLLHTFVGLLMFIWVVLFTASSAAIGCYTLVYNAILSGRACAPQATAPTVSPVDEHRASRAESDSSSAAGLSSQSQRRQTIGNPGFISGPQPAPVQSIPPQLQQPVTPVPQAYHLGQCLARVRAALSAANSFKSNLDGCIEQGYKRIQTAGGCRCCGTSWF